MMSQEDPGKRKLFWFQEYFIRSICQTKLRRATDAAAVCIRQLI